MGRRTYILGAVMLAAVCVTMASVKSSWAQAREDQPQESRQSIAMPATNQMVEIRASLPGQVKVGETFQYQIEVANVTDNVMLRDIKIQQTKNDGITVRSAKVQMNGQDRQTRSQGRQARGRQPADSKPQQAGTSDRPRQEQQAGPSSSGQTGREWTIDELGPGESCTIQVTATSEKEGELETCLAITSYTPALCLTTRSVKPDLELVKKTPERANLCDELEWEYYVKNTGSGDPGKFTIEDQLPQGLQTITGDKKLRFEVDGIDPGEVRKFVARLRADQPGEYRSAAVAVRGEGKQTRSTEAGTQIVAADLSVAIDGPRTRYVNRLVDYTVRVTNNGEAPAEDVTLTLRYPNELEMANATEPRASRMRVARTPGRNESATPDRANAEQLQRNQFQEKQGQQDQFQEKQPQEQGASRQDQFQEKQDQQQNQPRQNQAQDRQAQDRKTQDRQAQDRQAQDRQAQANPGQQSNQLNVMRASETRSWQLGTLQPGQTVEVGFTVRGSHQGTAQFEAVAEYVCQIAEGGTETSSVAQAQTQLIALPALMLAVVDDRDPVPVGETVEYTIIVGNEGEAQDSDIQVTAELPEGLEFVEASGETQAQSEGRMVKFAPVKELRPGQKVRWNVTAKATQEDEVRISVEMTSQHLSRKTISEEPTVLFGSKKQVSQKEKSASQR